jgi:hypothetical protein
MPCGQSIQVQCQRVRLPFVALARLVAAPIGLASREMAETAIRSRFASRKVVKIA